LPTPARARLRHAQGTLSRRDDRSGGVQHVFESFDFFDGEQLGVDGRERRHSGFQRRYSRNRCNPFVDSGDGDNDGWC
jgi:hypothetical protein